MTKAAVLAYLKENQDERGIAHWKDHAESSGGLKSFGIGLTRLRKYAKTLGRDPKLAALLWKTKIYEAKVISLLIDDPKTMTRAQAETQVENLQGGYLAHVFSSCDATLAKTPFVIDLLEEWIASKDPVRNRCGYGLLYEVSKWKKKSAPSEAWFLGHLRAIDKARKGASIDSQMSMGGAVMGIGMRSKPLNTAALKVAKKMGPLHFDPTGKCDPFNVTQRLSHPLVKKRLQNLPAKG